MIKQDISFVIPCRNNIRFFKNLAYPSIRKYGGEDIFICAADDASTDGTNEYFKELAEKDPYFKYITNSTGKRLGHTVLYDSIIRELVTTKWFIIFHCDMVLCPNSLESAVQYLKPKTIVSLTRIEPPLHPPGPEKVIYDIGTDIDSFKEKEGIEYTKLLQQNNRGKITNGIFAPWICSKKEFLEINGHDQDVFSPQSKEDSSIFNRFLLNGTTFIQDWGGYVLHLTCRGSRRADNPFKDTDEWTKQNLRSSRNFIRMWASFVKHDEYLYPIVPHKYKISAVIENCTNELLALLEPYFNKVYIDLSKEQIVSYIAQEQPNTVYNLSKRIYAIEEQNVNDNIIVKFNGQEFNQEAFDIINNLSEIITDSGQENSDCEISIFRIRINNMETYEKDLIIADNSGELR